MRRREVHSHIVDNANENLNGKFSELDDELSQFVLDYTALLKEGDSPFSCKDKCNDLKHLVNRWNSYTENQTTLLTEVFLVDMGDLLMQKSKLLKRNCNGCKPDIISRYGPLVTLPFDTLISVLKEYNFIHNSGIRNLYVRTSDNQVTYDNLVAAIYGDYLDNPSKRLLLKYLVIYNWQDWKEEGIIESKEEMRMLTSKVNDYVPASVMRIPNYAGMGIYSIYQEDDPGECIFKLSSSQYNSLDEEQKDEKLSLLE